MNKMVYQVLPTMSYGDAIGNDTLAIASLLRINGYENEIYAQNIHPRDSLLCRPFCDLADRVRPFDTVIYHMSTGCELTYWFKRVNCRKILIYHNITPSEFFEPYSEAAANLARTGRESLRNLAGSTDLCIADSTFNAKELLDLGYKDVRVIPILLPFADYEKIPDTETVHRMKDGRKNILFVGRVSPNKRHEDIISAFYAYSLHYNTNSRLVLAGSHSGMESYRTHLENYAKSLGILQDIVFTGHVSFAQILAYYKTADAFLCMSEHEGYCVPLVEALFFDVPVFARNCGAVSETLGSAGIRFSKRDFEGIAFAMNYIVSNPGQKEKLIKAQRNQLKKYDEKTIGSKMMNCLKDFLE